MMNSPVAKQFITDILIFVNMCLTVRKKKKLKLVDAANSVSCSLSAEEKQEFSMANPAHMEHENDENLSMFFSEKNSAPSTKSGSSSLDSYSTNPSTISYHPDIHPDLWKTRSKSTSSRA